MLTAVRKKFGEQVHRLYYLPIFYRRYNNVNGPFENSRYRRFAKRCRSLYAMQTGELLDPTTSGIYTQGSVLVRNVFPRAVMDELSREISRRFETKTGLLPGRYGHLYSDIEHPVSGFAKVTLNIFKNPEVDRELKHYFGGWYRVEWLTAYRTVPTKEKLESAWLWHSDSSPSETCKVMVFLTDAGWDRGATEFMSREDTMLYRDKGYFGSHLHLRRSDLDVFAKEHNLPYRPFHHEAKAGDVMLFENNVFHRAIPPIKDYRDVVCFTMLPNTRPWDEQLKREGIERAETTTRFPKVLER